MKTFTGIIIILIGLSFAITRGVIRYNASWEYENTILNNWQLADAASTISQKSAYIDAFVVALNKAELKGTNANMFYQTPATAFNQNYIALLSLQIRLKEISKMDANSFAYQTAIQQITEQEQGEAQNMLAVFEECWYYKHHYTLWNEFIGWAFGLIQVLLMLIGLAHIATVNE